MTTLTGPRAVIIGQAPGTLLFNVFLLDKDTGRPVIACISGHCRWDSTVAWHLPVVSQGMITEVHWHDALCWTEDETYAMANIADSILADDRSEHNFIFGAGYPSGPSGR